MVIISNIQRDYTVKYLDMLCNCLTGKDARTLNTLRLIKNLRNKLSAKEQLSITDIEKIENMLKKPKNPCI